MRLFILFLITINLISSEIATNENVTKLYVATFNRAPDTAGLKYWVEDSKLSLEEIAKSFFDQKETKKLYPSTFSNTQFIKAIYRNLFNREADNAGFNYWKEQLDSGKASRDFFILMVMNGALNEDAKILENKKEVGLYFAKKGLENVEDAKEIMKNISYDTPSKELAKSLIDISIDNNRSIKESRNLLPPIVGF